MQSSVGTALAFSVNEDGTVTLGDTTDEMDFTAERVTRELFAG